MKMIIFYVNKINLCSQNDNNSKNILLSINNIFLKLPYW